MKVLFKQPRDHYDFDVDMRDWLVEGDSITRIEVEAPEDLEITAKVFTSNRVKLWVKGGEAGKVYKISPLIHTQNRQVEADMIIAVKDI